MANTLTISRHKKGKTFSYFTQDAAVDNVDLIEWIDSLTIPPAWSEVKISRSKRSKVLATGYDAAGRQQYIYNPKFSAKQELLKFDRMLRFAQALPDIRRAVEHDLARKKLSQEKVLACIVKLIDEAYFRVGNDKYAQENQSYGITTIRSKHIDIEGDTVVFDFIGKSGKRHIKEITDSQIAHIVQKLDELPGYELFRYKDDDGTIHDIHSPDVNAYIKQHMGEEFTAKDFRTWGGTLVATTELIAAEYTSTKTAQQKMVANIVKNVASKLGNTPTIAKKSYIDPRVLAVYTNKTQLTEFKQAMANMRPRKYMTKDEQCLLKILQGAK